MGVVVPVDSHASHLCLKRSATSKTALFDPVHHHHPGFVCGARRAAWVNAMSVETGAVAVAPPFFEGLALYIQHIQMLDKLTS